MKSRTIIACVPLLLVLLSQSVANAFVVSGSHFRQSTALSVFGPAQAAAIEKRKNPQKFESTIQGLMKTKGLTREQAEKRYGEFLVDPDGFALAAAEAERKEKGYKNWEEQAIAKSDDPEATRARIEAFKNKNRTRGIIIMILFSAAAVANSVMNPYVPPVN
eukprot:CAMPEP_0197436310 /NCGR_PEP_ID=MMETSP1175-20131217/3779_1 /TAXON_ID=1003142 /ORGANISM="Triceratium dubium, Strain CCMP147" /LENGTH=161 /DNA_ID=CAMNT_0042965567 /DNA_START=79 /DNA_END=564 /DNA_ORIENTATION=+